MYFLLYDVKLSTNTNHFYLFGRELLITKDVDISKAQSRIRKLSINLNEASIPLFFICDEDVTTNNQIEDAIKDIKGKFKLSKAEEDSIEVLNYRNIFNKEFAENLKIIKMVGRPNYLNKNVKNIKKVVRQFSNYEEFFLISKNIKGPCVLKIDKTEDFIVHNQFKSVLLNPSNNITVIGKMDLPKINYSSLSLKHHNNIIEGFSLCINGNKFICGIKDTNEEVLTIKKGINTFKTYSNENKMIQDIQDLLDLEQIDNLIVYNLPYGILKQFNLSRFLFCDLYTYSFGTIKCRDYSLEDLCYYYNCKNYDKSDSNYDKSDSNYEKSDINYEKNSVNFCSAEKFAKLLTESKTIYDIYMASDALLLSKEMAEISGCTINKALSNNRSKIIDFALLHELNERNFMFPICEKHNIQQYTGGMVLVPVIGAYTDAVLLLDFNSLYPSIIQEFNVCFSTIGNSSTEVLKMNEETVSFLEKTFISKEKGFLPNIISNLVNRRREVKKLIAKNINGNNKIYDLRQKALKLLANSIYGCLGFPSSRFCNYKMASFITMKGRNLLEEAKNIAINDLGLDVIYGDTDSIMINTKLNYCDENLDRIKKIAEDIKSRINLRYKNIEIDLEKIFVRLFLYKKKKYAGLYAAGNGIFKKEYKGIDTVRRDVCKATIDILNGVLDILLDATKPLDYEESRQKVFTLLNKEAAKIKLRPVSDFIINMSLSKPLELYDKNAPLPHVFLAKRLMEKGIYIDQRDMISFVICRTENDEPIYKRACLPSEVDKIDFEYYLTNQIISSILKIVRIPTCINIEDLQRIFGCKVNSTNTQSITTHFVKFLTECCNKLQDPSDLCKSCNKAICEDFYFIKVKEMINNEIKNLYKTAPMCIDCNQYFNRFTKNCKSCLSPLVYKPENEEFNMFIDNISKSFSKSKFEQVKRFIEMHIEHSSFKIFDLKLFFNEEIENSIRSLKNKKQ